MPITRVEPKHPAEQDERRWWGVRKGEAPPRPLEVLARRFDALIEGREQCQWETNGDKALRVCDAWANLTDDQRDDLQAEGVFPNHPDFLGEWSGANWIFYLGCWVGAKERRERTRRAIQAAARGGGGDLLQDPVHGTVCGAQTREPSF